jgi:ribosomal protein S18 acetylase RimI-like enzyme
MTLSETSPAVSSPGPHEAASFLLRDRTWGAYPLGYLDPSSGILNQVWTTEEGGETNSLVMLAQLPQLVSIYASGAAPGIERLLGALPGPPASGVFSVRAEALHGLERHFHVSTSYQMRRMRADGRSLRPRHDVDVVRLGIDDLEAVKRIYGMWTDSHQLPGQLTRGIYYGVYRGRELVAIAGTHCVSPMYGVGAIGNVLTHAHHRNRGLASTTTSAVAEELLRLGCDEIVLNVRHGNDAAMATYRRLGFADHCTFMEGVFHARAGRR